MLLFAWSSCPVLFEKCSTHLEADDEVCIHDGGEAVGYYDGGSLVSALCQGALYPPLSQGV